MVAARDEEGEPTINQDHATRWPANKSGERITNDALGDAEEPTEVFDNTDQIRDANAENETLDADAGGD